MRLAALAVCLGCLLAEAGEVTWKRQQLDAKFRSEGVTAFDVNKDGKIDVVTGDVWYESPDWTIHEIRQPGDFNGASGYSQSFACFNFDINRDGWVDLITIGFPGEPCHWYENPQNKEGHWAKSEIWHSAANESPQFKDVTDDGQPELVMASETEGIVGYLEVPPKDAVKSKWVFTAVSTEKIPIGSHRYYHGIGVGDLNKDGRADIVIPHGWWEHPKNPEERPWKFHSHRLSKDGQEQSHAAADLHIDDLDLDGDMDIMMSSAHGHGIWWFENQGDGPDFTFKQHLIDDRYSQTHALHYQDVNGDGERDLITGKRFWAHGPKGDPDPAGQVVMFWYEVHKKAGAPEFIPHKIEEGVDTGIGTQFTVLDMIGDGKLDIVLSNKKGTNILIQK